MIYDPMQPPYRDPNTQVIGTCSKCGGEVVQRMDWYSTAPQEPRCTKCYAVCKKPKVSLPIIEME